MNDFLREIERAKSIVLLGHMRPDGDCVGSCLGVYNYVTDNYPDKQVDLYLDEFKPEFLFLRGADKVLHEKKDIRLDSSFYRHCPRYDRNFGGRRRG